MTGVPVAFLPGKSAFRAAGTLPPLDAVPGELLVLLELLELLELLHAAAVIRVAAARRTRGARRNARPAPLRCFVEIISYLAGRAGGLAARGAKVHLLSR